MRIVSIAKSNTEILEALGCGGEIIAATSYDKACAKLNRGFEVIGTYTDIDIGRIISLSPDIVFSSTFLQARYADELRENGVHVVHFDPLSVDDIMGNILHAGEAVGKEKGAKGCVFAMKKEIESIRKTAVAAGRQRLYAEEWPRPPMASGNWVVEMIEIAGARGILKPGEHSRKVSLEEVADFAPDKIMLNWCGIGKKADMDLLLKRSGWDRVSAVKQKKIFAVDDSFFNTPSQNVVKGIGELSRILNSENN